MMEVANEEVAKVESEKVTEDTMAVSSSSSPKPEVKEPELTEVKNQDENNESEKKTPSPTTPTLVIEESDVEMKTAKLESNLNVTDDDDDDDDDDYLSSKRLKIDEGDDEKSPVSEKQAETPVMEANDKFENKEPTADPVEQTSKNEEIPTIETKMDIIPDTTPVVNTAPTPTTEPVIDKEIVKSPSPLPSLTSYSIGESATPPPVASDEAASTEANMGDDSSSPSTAAQNAITEDAASPSDNSLKVPPLKIICSKGDFSLVNEIESQKSNENSNSSTTSKKGDSSETADTESSSAKKASESDSDCKKEPLKPTTIIIRKTGDNEVYEATSATTSATVTSTRSSSRLANNDIKPPSSKRPVREAASQIVRNSSRNSLIASPVNENNIKPISSNFSSSSGNGNGSNGANKMPDTVAGIGLRRKLRSHTRQQQGSGALSPSNTMSNSSTDFLEQGIQEDMEDVKKETDVAEVQVAAEDTSATASKETPSNSRKRKVRQQAQQQISSENSNDASQVVATTSTTSVTTTSTTATPTITVTTATSGAATIPPLQQSRAFLNTNNCIKQFVEIRNEIIKRRELLKQSSVEPKLPQNYEDFCLFKKNYLIKGNEEALFSIPFVS